MRDTFEVNGTKYVGAREIERYYKLCKSKQWRMIKASGIEPITIANSFFYPVDQVEAYMSENIKK